MNAAKIRLSPPEMELVLNADWILTKNRVMDKAREMMGMLRGFQQEIIEENWNGVFPDIVMQSGAKLTRGENYLGLPWLVLDHPRLFQKEDVMALRSFFWWGRFFSVTLHLAGRYKTLYENQVLSQWDSLQKAPRQTVTVPGDPCYYICVHSSPWEHHFERENYRPAEELSREEWESVIRDKPFIKLARKIPLTAWEGPFEICDVLGWHYYSLLKLLGGRQSVT